MNTKPFTHLHVHTEYSLLDGAIRIDPMLEKCRAFGMHSVAVTDHGNMFAAVDFYSKASKAGIKPIIGSEVYVAPGPRGLHAPSPDGQPNSYHLVLLVMNNDGYKNICRLLSAAHLEGFYYRPRIDMDLLRECNKGLIALSACIKGHIPDLILKNRYDKAKDKAAEFVKIFDDRFYLEVQPNSLKEQAIANNGLKELSRDLSIPMVATNDCHYLEKRDAEIQDVLLCIQTGATLNDEKRLKFSSDDFFFKTYEEMLSNFSDFTDAVDYTNEIASRCNFEMSFGQYKLPAFSVPDDTSLDEIFEKDSLNGLNDRLDQKRCEEGNLSEDTIKEYTERLNFEISTIREMGFEGYFLIVADFIRYARSQNIPVGPGRGSAAGSLVAYSLKITNIDPIKYGLLFERFLNPGRISMPDIDIDFCINGRGNVLKYVSEKYGRENVSQIVTFGTMKARGAVRDVGRVLDIPLAEVDAIAKLIPESHEMTLEKAVNIEPELRHIEGQKDTLQSNLLRIARAVEGQVRHYSTHACGVVIADRPLEEYTPRLKGRKKDNEKGVIDSDEEILTQYTMEYIEKIGLLKFDFLGLKTLTVINDTVKSIAETDGITIDVDAIPLDDPETFKLCSEGRTTGVFQLESSGMKELLRKFKPEKFEDVIALVAIFRPGPLGSGMVDDFIRGKNGGDVKYFLPQLESVLKETYGVILYQEQVMKIAQVISGYSLAEADELRKAVGKKKKEIMDEHEEIFIERAVKSGISNKKAEKLFSLIQEFGGYGFNKSHSAGYALIAYQTAWLKAHYPVHFMSALLSQDMGFRDKTIKNIQDCREMKIKILPPDINESQSDFTTKGGNIRSIRFGLAAVKNVGGKAVESIIDERNKNGPFENLFDFCKRIDGSKVNRRVIESLIESGTFDFTGLFRASLCEGLEGALKSCGSTTDPDQISFFDLKGSSNNPFFRFKFPEVREWDEKELLFKEKEALGFYITSHPLKKFEKELINTNIKNIDELNELPDKSEVNLAGVINAPKIKKTKRGDKEYAIFNIEDLYGFVEVIVFNDLLIKIKHLLSKDDPIFLYGIMEKDDYDDDEENTSRGGKIKIIAKDIKKLGNHILSTKKTLYIELFEEAVSFDILQELKTIVVGRPGDCELYFRVALTNGGYETIRAGDRFSIQPSADLLTEIKKCAGEASYSVEFAG